MREVEIFLGVDFAILAVRIGMTELDALFDHVLKEMNQVRLLELRSAPIRLVPEFPAAAVVMLAQKLAAAGASRE